MRPIVEIMYQDFMTLAMEQLVQQAAKHRYMSGGQTKVPLTIRTQGGAGWSPGAQHAQQVEAWFVHVPGIKVVFPSTPEDVRGLLWSSIYDDNPVVFFEHRTLYNLKNEVPEAIEGMELGKARVHREGEDVTVVATGRLVHEALAAAKEAEEDGISVEVVDPRTLLPLDEDGDRRLRQEDEPLRRRARGRRPHGLRRRGRGDRAAPGVRLPRRAGRARRGEVHPDPVRAGHGAVRHPACGGRARGRQAHRRQGVAVSSQVTLPRLGQGMESGTIVRWLKSEGDQVEKGEPLYELDTEKVTQEVEADSSGVLLKILAGEGEEIEVGKAIAVIGEEGEDVPDAEPEAKEEQERRSPLRQPPSPRSGRPEEPEAPAASEPEPQVPRGDRRRRRTREGVAAGQADRARAGHRPALAARNGAGGAHRGRGRRARPGCAGGRGRARLQAKSRSSRSPACARRSRGA